MTDQTVQHIHVQWKGPYSYEEAMNQRDQNMDKGVYQVYGTHPVYGSNVLLYIGKTINQTFGQRLSQEIWLNNHDSKNVVVYLGFIAGYDEKPSEEMWSMQITTVERLLIYAHWPAGNSSGLNIKIGSEYHNVHILNWGERRSLLPEVSGAFYSDKYAYGDGYSIYKSTFGESDITA